MGAGHLQTHAVPWAVCWYIQDKLPGTIGFLLGDGLQSVAEEQGHMCTLHWFSLHVDDPAAERWQVGSTGQWG